MQITPLGTAMMLLEIGSLRLLTDPVFDRAGGRYRFGFGTGGTKLTNPAISEEDVGKIDAVLLSHEHHSDNLDHAGRAFLPKAGKVITTHAGAQRLGGATIGLRPWASTQLGAMKVTATPAQHGPRLFSPVLGETIGFVLEWPGQQHGAVYISGDTVWFSGVAEVARRFKVGTAILHMGSARFPIFGPLRFTFNGTEAARIGTELKPHTIIPTHYEGWTHFHEPREVSDRAFAQAGLTNKVKWLPLGTASEIDV